MSLGDLIHVKHGYAFKGEFFAPDGKEVVLTPGNFPIGGGLHFRPGKDRYYTGSYPPEYRLTPGDLLVVMTDLTQNAPILGSPAFVPESPSVLHNQRLGLVTTKPGVDIDRRFLYYVLLSDITRAQVRASATGTTVKHTAPERIYRVSVDVPPLPIQRKIGEILGSIDDLIENNRRRVQILDEMVQTIYREWFIRFRFPGHEALKLVDPDGGPIPEGWELTSLGAVVDLKYGKALKKDDRNGGQVAVVGSSGIVGWHNEMLIDGPAIVLGRKGNVGSVTWLDGPCWPIDTTYFVESKLSLRYVVEQLKRTEFLDTHAAVPGLSRDVAYSRPFLVPPDELILVFTKIADAFGCQASALLKQNLCLSLTRDLLLPRIMTGQFDLSSFFADPVVLAAAT
jgi:type I restriction enzyme S subunit